jgi:hypothetical protein
MTSLDQTRPQRRLPAIATTAVAQLTVLLLLCWGLVLYLNWSSDVAVAEFMATAKPPAAAAGEPHASVALQPAHHQGATCPRRT